MSRRLDRERKNRKVRRSQAKHIRRDCRSGQVSHRMPYWTRWQRVTRDDRPDVEWLDGCEVAYHNSQYCVQRFELVTAWGGVTLLMLRRVDGGAVVPWAEAQRVKDELIGPERTAVEVYPARSELIDQANVFHLWVLPKGFELPFGLLEDGLLIREVADGAGE